MAPVRLIAKKAGCQLEQQGDGPGRRRGGVGDDRIRVYRGTSHPDVPQVSRSMRTKLMEEVLSGEQHFLSSTEAREHAFHGRGFHPDGVSVTAEAEVAALYGSHTVIYDIPRRVFDRLPVGDPTLGERVFKFSIPEAYRVGVMKP